MTGRRWPLADRLIAPLALFVSLYLATSWSLVRLVALPQWAALVAVSVASAGSIWLAERGQWSLGLLAPARTITRESLGGIAVATVLVLGGDVLIVCTTQLRHGHGSGFPWLDLVAVFLPAAFHEELLFRGYVYQKLRQWNRGFAIGSTSILFAALHGGAPPIARANIALAGVLLAVAYERHQRLWMPIALHLTWNLLSGPILGYPVSGFVSMTSLFTVTGGGPKWLTGGAFGIEASAWMFLLELTAIGAYHAPAFKPTRRSA